MSSLNSIFYSEQFISSITKCEHLLHRFFSVPEINTERLVRKKIVIKPRFMSLTFVLERCSISTPHRNFILALFHPTTIFSRFAISLNFPFGLSHFHLHTLTFKKARPFSRNILSLSPNYLGSTWRGGVFSHGRCRVGVMMLTMCWVLCL